MSGREFHRPRLVSPDRIDLPALAAAPETVVATAHETAAALVRRGRAAQDPEVTRRLVDLVDECGLEEVAALWSQRPARSLPGALWRVYALRTWIVQHPGLASRRYAEGRRYAEVSTVVAGMAEPPGPEQVRALADEILRGVYTGDVGVALDRAAAFCRIVAAGTAAEPTGPGEVGQGDGGWGDAGEVAGPGAAAREAERAAALLTTAGDLSACAQLWRADSLV